MQPLPARLRDEVGDRRGHRQNVALRKFRGEEVFEIRGALERDEAQPFRPDEPGRSGEESHARPAVARRLRERVTHPSARTVGDEPNRVEPLAGRSGGDEDA